MKVSNSRWKEQLEGKVPEYLDRELDVFETEITLRKQGKLDERLFAETRLRRGAYCYTYTIYFNSKLILSLTSDSIIEVFKYSDLYKKRF